MLLGQGCPCGWAITTSAGLFKNKKETKWFSSRSRVRTRRFGGFSTSSRRSLPLRASPGWGYLHRVRDHSASPLLLLVENGVLITYFPTSQCLKQRAVGSWVLPGADRRPECSQRRLLVEGKDHLPHPLGCSTSAGSPAGLHAAAVNPLSPPVHPISDAPHALILPHAVRGLPFALCASKASPEYLLFPALLAGLLPVFLASYVG